MKVYKKIMNGLAFVEKLVLVLSTILIVVLTDFLIHLLLVRQ